MIIDGALTSSSNEISTTVISEASTQAFAENDFPAETDLRQGKNPSLGGWLLQGEAILQESVEKAM